MCSPSGGGSGGSGGGIGTAGYVGLGLQGASLGAGISGSYYGAVMQQNALNFQADMARINQRLSEVSAKQELERGSEQEKQVILQGEKLKSSQRAAMAANGIELGFGTAKNILDSTDMMLASDVDTVRANAARAAFGYRTQGIGFSNQSAMANASAGSISPALQTATSMLGSAGNVAQSWYMMNRK